MLTLLPFFWGLVLLAICWTAAIKDLKTYTIPHIYPGLVILLFIFGLFFCDWNLAFLGWQAASVALVFLAGFILFILSAMGGGDVKLFTALGLWIPFSKLGIYLFMVTFIGAIIAAMILVFRTWKYRRDPENQNKSRREALNYARKTKHQYGLPIAIGTTLFWIWLVQAGQIAV